MRMAEIRRNLPVQPLDLGQIVQEAQQRWLRPAEICEILRNYKKFHLKTEPPVRPPAGSLFLFDRKALRYFRKDGYSWRKKKDGKTVKEAHEKLKAGSVDVLHCYYAHGEDNKYFQRRSYWMLDEQLENIVLVHYREVEEGHKFSVSRPLNSDPVSQLGSPQTSSVPCLQNTNSPVQTAQLSYASSPSTVDWSEQPLFSEFDDRESGEDAVRYSAIPTTHGSASHNISLYADESTGFLNPGTSSSIWADMHGFKRNINSLQEQRFYMNRPNGADLLAHKLIDAKLDADSVVKDWSYGDRLPPDTHRELQEHGSHLVHPQVLRNSPSQEMVTSVAIVESSAQGGEAGNGKASELKKLDSFGRWLDKEIGGYCEGSFMAADSGKYWSTLDTENNDKEVSCLSHHMQLDVHSLGPSLSREQLFSIHDFAPDWAYSGVATKVLVIGMFLGDEKHSSSFKWCCMFGGTEVSAEVLTDNVIRCEVPSHDPGRVPFYVTCGNRLACSEVREFEYCEKPLGASPYFAIKSAAEDELRFQIRLAKLLHLSIDRKWFDCSIADCDKSRLINDMCLVMSDAKLDWGRIEEALVLLERDHATNMLIQNLFMEKLCIWLFCKVHEGGKGPHLLDDEGQGVIHLAAALGYEWAMSHIVAAGVSPNFRDARGWTALHWASYYGREGTVVALVTLGAAPGAVNDPIAEFPGGQTAADLASSRDYKGIAGYLAEADLTSLLSSLTFNENALHSVAATIISENPLENAKQSVFPSDGKMDDELCLRESLAAVRKSAHAAAVIQDAFRVRSFRHRQLTKGRSDVSEVSFDLVALGSLNKVQNMGHFEDYLHSAAIKIQQKYRGWKGRKEFLKIRNRIVKIQAHLRGHQVRKEYKKVVWSVGIVEKAILRWRRRRPGLRGFRMEKTTKNLEAETESNDEYEFLRIGRKQKSEGVEKALARVQSMARHPEARNQYMRLVTKFEDFKIGNEVGSGSQVVKVSEKKIKKEDLTAL